MMRGGFSIVVSSSSFLCDTLGVFSFDVGPLSFGVAQPGSASGGGKRKGREKRKRSSNKKKKEGENEKNTPSSLFFLLKSVAVSAFSKHALSVTR